MSGSWNTLQRSGRSTFRASMPVLFGLCAGIGIVIAGSAAPLRAQGVIDPSSLQYQGAFRLPGGEDRPATFAYGGNAMTFNPGGDPGGSGDGFPGSLFITGHERMAYGELPNGDQVAEVSIPAPGRAGAASGLPQAGFLQPFRDVAAGWFPGLDEIPRVALQYLDAPPLGPRLHIAWGQHMQPESPTPSHALLSPNLSAPAMQGPWFIGNQSPYSVNGYMLAIPADWAAAHTQGRRLGTGRYRDGGWSGMGPQLFAYSPWDAQGNLATPGSRLPETVLLRYRSSRETDGDPGGARRLSACRRMGRGRLADHGGRPRGGAVRWHQVGRHALLVRLRQPGRDRTGPVSRATSSANIRYAGWPTAANARRRSWWSAPATTTIAAGGARASRASSSSTTPPTWRGSPRGRCSHGRRSPMHG